MIRLAGLDSGKQRDSSALVIGEVDKMKNRLIVKGMKRWLHRNYIDVENEIAELHARKPCEYYVVEINNVGVHVAEVLQIQKKLPVWKISTTGEITDPKKKHSGTRMDKNEMVRVMSHWIFGNMIVFPKESTPELDELKRQLSIFSEHKTPTSTVVRYFAEGTEHDDGVMALMMICFIAQRWIGLPRNYTMTPVAHWGMGANEIR